MRISPRKIAASSRGMRTLCNRWILPAAITVHLLAAWFSTGFHSADEHYQVVAFAEAKLGHLPVNGLSWEYAAQIRSSFLPAVCMGVFSAARSIGIHDPFILTLLLRLLTAALALFAVSRFVRAVQGRVPADLRTHFLLLSWFLWFLPFLHVRFTGETWSGLLFLIGLATLLDPEPLRVRHLRSGLFFGLAFLCRPPVLLMAGGVLAWLVYVRGQKGRQVLPLAAGIAAVVLAGVALDSWFYGGFTITAGNYLRLGLTGMDDQRFLTYPWWYYYAWVLKYAIPFFGLPVLLAFGLLCALRPRHVLVWTSVPFLVLHMLLPHKELRFLYPLADLVPWMLVSAWSLVRERPLFRRLPPVALKSALGLLAGVDLLALAAVCLAPAGYGNARLAEAVRGLYGSHAVRIEYLAGNEAVWRPRIPHFYLAPAATDSMVKDPCPALLRERDMPVLLVADHAPGTCHAGDEVRWQVLAPAIPRWKEILLRGYEGANARPVWKLYRPVRTRLGLNSAP